MTTMNFEYPSRPSSGPTFKTSTTPFMAAVKLQHARHILGLPPEYYTDGDVAIAAYRAGLNIRQSTDLLQRFAPNYVRHQGLAPATSVNNAVMGPSHLPSTSFVFDDLCHYGYDNVLVMINERTNVRVIFENGIAAEMEQDYLSNGFRQNVGLFLPKERMNDSLCRVLDKETFRYQGKNASASTFRVHGRTTIGHYDHSIGQVFVPFHSLDEVRQLGIIIDCLDSLNEEDRAAIIERFHHDIWFGLETASTQTTLQYHLNVVIDCLRTIFRNQPVSKGEVVVCRFRLSQQGEINTGDERDSMGYHYVHRGSNDGHTGGDIMRESVGKDHYGYYYPHVSSMNPAGSFHHREHATNATNSSFCAPYQTDDSFHPRECATNATYSSFHVEETSKDFFHHRDHDLMIDHYSSLCCALNTTSTIDGNYDPSSLYNAGEVGNKGKQVPDLLEPEDAAVAFRSNDIDCGAKADDGMLTLPLINFREGEVVVKLSDKERLSNGDSVSRTVSYLYHPRPNKTDGTGTLLLHCGESTSSYHDRAHRATEDHGGNNLLCGENASSIQGHNHVTPTSSSPTSKPMPNSILHMSMSESTNITFGVDAEYAATTVTEGDRLSEGAILQGSTAPEGVLITAPSTTLRVELGGSIPPTAAADVHDVVVFKHPEYGDIHAPEGAPPEFDGILHPLPTTTTATNILAAEEALMSARLSDGDIVPSAAEKALMLMYHATDVIPMSATDAAPEIVVIPTSAMNAAPPEVVVFPTSNTNSVQEGVAFHGSTASDTTPEGEHCSLFVGHPSTSNCGSSSTTTTTATTTTPWIILADAADDDPTMKSTKLPIVASTTITGIRHPTTVVGTFMATNKNTLGIPLFSRSSNTSGTGILDDDCSPPTKSTNLPMIATATTKNNDVYFSSSIAAQIGTSMAIINDDTIVIPSYPSSWTINGSPTSKKPTKHPTATTTTTITGPTNVGNFNTMIVTPPIVDLLLFEEELHTRSRLLRL